MTKSVPLALQTHLEGEVTTVAVLWELVRKDGTAFYFTDHDADIVYAGNTYKASSGFTRTAIVNDASLSVDNLDVEGIFNSDDIREDELRAGLFDGAEVKIRLVNYESLVDGDLKLRRGVLGEVVSTEQGFFKTELRGMNQRLQQNVGSNYTAPCRVDLGGTKCKVGIKPADLERNTLYKVGEYMRIETITSYLDIVNPTGNTGDTTGWTNDTGTMRCIAAIDADQGDGADFYFAGGAADATTIAYQDIAVEVSEEAAIDAGERVFRCDFAQGSTGTNNDKAQVFVDCLDSGSVSLATFSSTLETAATWTVKKITGAVPANTRFFRITLKFVRVTGTTNDGHIDNISLVTHDSTLTGTLASFGDVVFKCISKGTTHFGLPVFDFTPGNESTDGTCTWRCVEAFTKQGTVSLVTNNRVFQASDLPSKPDGWFKYGAVKWLTGNNAGSLMEVRNHTNTDRELTLFLPMGFDIQVGDTFTVYPGCDKIVTTCRDKFDNVPNFRGFPDIPGTDLVTSYPDPPT